MVRYMPASFVRDTLIRPKASLRKLGRWLALVSLPCAALQAAGTKLDIQEGIGQIVQPATGTDRAVYTPLDRPVILPQFFGTWAAKAGKCLPQSYKNRMELRSDLAIIAGHSFTVRTVYVDAGPPNDREGDIPLPAASYADARDMLVELARAGDGAPRIIHFHFSDRSGRLILEEVGKARTAYVRCRL